MSTISSFAPLVGSACCCLAFFVLLIVIAAFLFRSKKPTPEQIEGLPPAPGSGVQTQASLTMLEYEPTQRTPRPAPRDQAPRDAAPKPSSPASPARSSNPPVPRGPFKTVSPDAPPPTPDSPSEELGMTSVVDRGRPSLPPPPAPPPGTITLSPMPAAPANPRIVEPRPTVDPSNPPPTLPPRSGKP